MPAKKRCFYLDSSMSVGKNSFLVFPKLFSLQHQQKVLSVFSDDGSAYRPVAVSTFHIKTV